MQDYQGRHQHLRSAFCTSNKSGSPKVMMLQCLPYILYTPSFALGHLALSRFGQKRFNGLVPRWILAQHIHASMSKSYSCTIPIPVKLSLAVQLHHGRREKDLPVAAPGHGFLRPRPCANLVNAVHSLEGTRQVKRLPQQRCAGSSSVHNGVSLIRVRCKLTTQTPACHDD